MSTISAVNLQAISDNIAKTLVDLEAVYIINPTANSPTIDTIANGQTGIGTSLSARVAGLGDLSQVAALSAAALAAANNVIGYTNIGVTSLYILYSGLLSALDLHVSGLDSFLTANAVQVHSEFAAAFNYIANNAIVLGARGSNFTPVSPANVFIPANQTLATIVVTASNTGTYSEVSPIDLTQYGPAELFLKNILGATSGGTATSFQVAYTNASGSPATATITLTGTMADQATIDLGVTGSEVTNITIISGGVASDYFAIVAAPPRSISY